MAGVRDFFRFGPAQADHLSAARIAVGIAPPLLIVMALGRVDLAVFAAFGSFTGIYAKRETLRRRVIHQSLAGAIILVCLTLGLLCAHAQVGGMTIVLIGSVVAALGAVVAASVGFKPSGSVFFVFAFTSIAALPTPPSFPSGIGVAAATVAFCVLLGYLARILPGMGGGAPVLGGSFTRAQLAWHGGQFLVVALVAGTLGQLTGVGHSNWAMVAGIAAIAAPDAPARVSRAVHRVVGTLAGVAVSAVILGLNPDPWPLALVVIVLQFLGELFVIRHYATALIFITPLALCMMQLGNPLPVEQLVFSRAVETVIGAAVAVGIVMLLGPAVERVTRRR
ncbi:FUSC family protein [Tersicoccus solisilvae]|uniref:FUSC family protein n=1 Tax=Tersicoccus solisilvae TaxID=1882339 RepID=UPI00166669F1|nr:FUSC family protein [Tersicoccus solisilvae]